MQQFHLTEGHWCDVAGYPIALAYARDGKAVVFIASEPDETSKLVKLAAENWRLKNLPQQLPQLQPSLSPHDPEDYM